MLLNHQQGYKELDAILDSVQELFGAIVAREGLQQVSIERWRWDYPVITLIWATGDIQRNINVLLGYAQDDGLLSASGEPIIEVVEVNAWKDNDAADRNRVRIWRYAVIVRKAKTGRDQERLGLLERSIQLAYKEVSNFTENQLDRKTVIESASSGFY